MNLPVEMEVALTFAENATDTRTVTTTRMNPIVTTSQHHRPTQVGWSWLGAWRQHGQDTWVSQLFVSLCVAPVAPEQIIICFFYFFFRVWCGYRLQAWWIYLRVRRLRWSKTSMWRAEGLSKWRFWRMELSSALTNGIAKYVGGHSPGFWHVWDDQFLRFGFCFSGTLFATSLFALPFVCGVDKRQHFPYFPSVFSKKSSTWWKTPLTICHPSW